MTADASAAAFGNRAAARPPTADVANAPPETLPLEFTPEEAKEYIAYVEQRFRDLLRIVGKVAAGDFSEKPEIHERQDDFSRFVVGFRFMIEDLERAQKEEAERRAALQQAHDRLKDLDVMRTQFINSAAHELSTPLTPLKIELYNLRLEPNVPAGVRQSLEMVDRNVERLARLVGDLMDAARLQSDRVRLVAAPVDVLALVTEAAEFYRAAAVQAGVRLEVSAGPPVRTHGDPVRLSQVFYNLLSNAIKFTPRGGWVRCDVEQVRDHAVVRVSDSGVGMTEAQRERLFQPFSQVHEMVAGRPKGNGLGLFISRGMVELHGGQIRCDSAGPGKGTTFTVRVPIQNAPRTAA